jgi:hypothetical protein
MSHSLNEKFLARLLAKPGQMVTLSGISFSSHPDKSRRQVQNLQSQKALKLKNFLAEQDLPGDFTVRTRSTPVSARIDAKYSPVVLTRDTEWLMAKVNKVLAADKATNIQAVASGFTERDVERLEQMRRELTQFVHDAQAPVTFALYRGVSSLTLVGKPVR